MHTNEPVSQKRIVSTLDFDARTAKRATWEAFSFTVTDTQTVHVVNDSYGDDAEAHAYDVTVGERDGLFAPVDCDCPAADRARLSGKACKHQLAAAIAGPVLMGAAVTYAPPAVTVDDDATATALATDGGESGGADEAYDHAVDAARDEDLALDL